MTKHPDSPESPLGNIGGIPVVKNVTDRFDVESYERALKDGHVDGVPDASYVHTDSPSQAPILTVASTQDAEIEKLKREIKELREDCDAYKADYEDVSNANAYLSELQRRCKIALRTHMDFAEALNKYNRLAAMSYHKYVEITSKQAVLFEQAFNEAKVKRVLD